mmetsp:Transcript_19218/g.39138  ORF Transcript_19218/g.39138 Transcript_19218/m.39138 type:complete len:356 (-) Transcript_19218:653-1720(-)
MGHTRFVLCDETARSLTILLGSILGSFERICRFVALPGGSRGPTPVDSTRFDVESIDSTPGQEFPGAELALIKAASLGEIESLKEFLRQGLPVNMVRAGHGTALHAATRGKRCDAIRLLLRARADVEARDEHGFLPIQHAVLQGDLESYRELVPHHEHVWDVTTSDGDTLLHLATKDPPSKELVAELLEKGVAIAPKNSTGQTCSDQLRAQGDSALREGRVARAKWLSDLEIEIHAAALERKRHAQREKLSSWTRKPHDPSSGVEATPLEPEDGARLLREWLESTGISQVDECCKLFAMARRGYDDIHSLDDASLLEMGVSKIGVRNKILAVVKKEFQDNALLPNMALLQQAGLI